MYNLFLMFNTLSFQVVIVWEQFPAVHILVVNVQTKIAQYRNWQLVL